MSRHRFVKNLDIDAERDDGALSDGADEEMTPEQTAQMEDGLDRVRTVLGDEATSGLSDRIVKEMLWESYFDVDQTIDWLVQEQDKQKQARERKGHATTNDPSAEYGVPATRGPGPLIHQSRQHIDLDPEMDEEGSGCTRLTIITEHTELTETSASRRYVPGRGFTAYRRRDSQQTSASPGTPSAQAAPQLPPRESMASTMSSFGQVIRHYDTRDEDLTSDSQSFADALSTHTDPNQIEPSPPPSALGPSEVTTLPVVEDEYGDAGSDRTASPPPNHDQTLSPEPVPPFHAQIPLYARSKAVEVDVFAPRVDSPAGSLTRSQTSFRTDTPPRNAPTSSPSKSSATSTAQGRSLSPPVNKPLPSLPPPSPSSPFPPATTISQTPTQSLAAPPTSKRTSKLSALASSRASTITKSSRLSGGTVGSESILTFPALRPSRESIFPPSVASVVNIPPPNPSAPLLALVAEEGEERAKAAPGSGSATPKSGSGSGSASLSSGARRRGETEAQAIARLARARASHSGESLGLSPSPSSHGTSTPPGITVQSATATPSAQSEVGDQAETRSFDSALFRTGRPAPPADDDVSLIGSSFEGHGPVPGQGQVYGGDARNRVLSDTTGESGMSSIVCRAIQSALELEAVDKERAKAKEEGNMAGVGALMGGKAPALPEVQRESEIEPAPTPPPPAVASPPRIPPTSPPYVPPTAPPRMSKLQARARAAKVPPQNPNQGRTPSMAESVDIFAPPATRLPASVQPSPVPLSSEATLTEPFLTPTSTELKDGKGSKLAALAAKRAALARKTTTRYLPPGTSTLSPTVTTAITTSYHTRDTMGPLPALGMSVVSEEERERERKEGKKSRRSSVSKDGTRESREGRDKEGKKESKLAEKARAARRRKEEADRAEAEENKPTYDPLSAPGPESWAAHLPVPTPAIFVPQLRDAGLAAMPSGFAATLTTGADGAQRRRSSSTGVGTREREKDGEKEKVRPERRERRRSASRDREGKEKKKRSHSHSHSHSHASKDPERKHRRSKRESKGKEKERSPSSPPPPPSKFTFDTLSPDDVVLNARRGTALAGAPGFASPRESAAVGGEAGALGLMTGSSGVVGTRDSVAGSERPASTAQSARTGTSVGTGETWVTAPYAGTAGASLRSRVA